MWNYTILNNFNVKLSNVDNLDLNLLDFDRFKFTIVQNHGI